MSRVFGLSETERQALREELEQRLLTPEEHIDRVLAGYSEEEMREALQEAREALVLDRKIELEQLREAARISRRNRGEE